MITTRRDLAELADEYVIGLCDAAEQLEIDRRMETEPELARLVERARLRFAALDEATPEAQVPGTLWSRLEAGLDEEAKAGDKSGGAADAERAAAAAGAEETVVPFTRAEDRRRGPLLWTTGLSLAASLVLAVALGWSLLTGLTPQVVAVLISDDGQPVAMVEGAADNTTRVTLLGETDVPAGSVLQLWTKPDPDGPPVSLGVFDEPKRTLLEAAGLPAPTSDQLYEITFEQPGGSPTGLPTGPILGKGFTKEPR